MNKVTLLLLLTALLVNSQFTDKKVVNSCLQDEIDMSKIVPQDYLETFDEKYGQRKLQRSEPQPFRITLDFNELDNPLNGAGMTPSLKEYIKKIMYAAQTFLNKLIKVHPRQKPNKYTWFNHLCYDTLLSEQIKTVGVDNSDLHIFVTYGNERASYVANAIWCNLDPNPNVGRVKFNLGNMFIDETSGQSFLDYFSVALHEIMHILGFSGNSIQYWIDPDTGSAYGYWSVEKILKKERRWDIENVTKISSKNLLKVSRNHYNCPSIDGMYLENQGEGGSFGSHWERDLLGNEFMTASTVFGYYTISEFTAALLLDTGYYAEINQNLLMPLYWGKNKGCDFFNKSCNAGKYFAEFSDDTTREGCDFYSYGIGRRYKTDPFSQCENIVISIQGRCDSDDFKSENFFRQNPGAGSRCFRSNSNAKGENFLNIQGRCFKAQCSNDLSSIKVNVWENEFVTCQYPNQVINLAEQTKTTQGVMKCPDDFELFCGFPKQCPNKCSSNGICINGFCICLKGYAGDDCSKRCGEDQVWDGAHCTLNCPSGLFKNFDNTCKTTCPYKQYGDQATRSCAVCSNKCSACFGPSSNQCISCNNGFILQGNQCIEATCHSSCQTCSGPNANQCTSCPSGTYLDSSKTCQPCQAPCESCFNSATECTTCVKDYEIDKASGQCIFSKVCDISCQDCYVFRDPRGCLTCKDGYFYNGSEGSCQKCDESCSKCTYRKDKCIECSSGYEYDGYNQRCYQLCHESCESCTAPQNPKACKSCAYNHVMQNNLCVPCDINCIGCRDEPTKCIECVAGYKFDHSQQTCVSVCNPGEYQDTDGSCQKCVSPCATCQYQSDFCYSCISGYTYNAQINYCIPNTNSCHESCNQCSQNNDPNSCTSCRDGMYLSSGKCQYCSNKCQTCEFGPNKCTSCQSNEFLLNNQCQQCHNSCLTCSGKATNCTSCQDGLLKDPKTGICIMNTPICRSNEYLDSKNQCQKCLSPCASCSNQPYMCSSCISGYKLNSQTLQCEQDIITCKDGQFLDQNNKCKPCHSFCNTCEQQSDRCTSCRPGLLLIQSFCYDEVCQDGYFKNQQGKCQRCSESCSKCVNYQDQCTECANEYTLDSRTQRCIKNSSNQKCHPNCKECSQPNNALACYSCKDGLFLNNRRECVQCDNSCLTCDRYQDFCTSCQQGYKLDATGGKCTPDCKSNEYLDSKNQCQKCLSPCASCSNQPNMCLTCISGYKLNSQTRQCEQDIITCRDGQFLDQNNKCKPCHSFCNTCEQQSDRCTSCRPGFLLIQSFCYDEVCQDGYFKNQQGKCQRCSESCSKCVNYQDQCTECANEYTLDSRTQRCIKNSSNQKCHPNCKECSQPNNALACYSCKDGLFLNNRRECVQCDNSCLTCDRYQDFCTSCQQGYKLDAKDGKCTPDCKSNEYLDFYENKCKPCTSPCGSCEYYPDRCTSCISGYKYDNEGYSCEIICQPGQYADRDQICKPCSSPCATCEYYDNRCLSCVSGYTYTNYNCQQTSRPSMRGCHESCNTCTRAMDPRSCDSCREGYVLMSGSCQKKKGNYSNPKN
ncbi:transmembrane protein, putative (macronuclear) [Tetrahymena thermophila SB210]|uniref:Transmembrane protein, putative n=1 Tax=Tetrahymena thermophila (strain SB210) TaxID=312017 RepID=I7M096_TETTS|nr:transmembrane protein, putative [Tetrahymena thermophila SB210]EAR86018.1 transmembrane protein, putative [Tetrahymena thermophila SB210]|eukprot:XP_976613.1 transmembrane protein, putative [Tetrahymena thermophila SB210]